MRRTGISRTAPLFVGAVLAGVVSVTAQGAAFGFGPLAHAAIGQAAQAGHVPGAAPGVAPAPGRLIPAVSPVIVPAQGNGPDLPAAAAVGRVLAPALASRSLGKRVGVVVVDVESGQVVYAKAGTASFMPASVTKLVTAVIAVDVLGADTRWNVRREGRSKRLVAGTAQSPGTSTAGLVEGMLKTSDNALAQGLADRAVAASGRPWAELVPALLSARGIDVNGLVLRDGSGLSRSNRIPASLPARLLATVAAGGTADPWWPALSGLPVAGWDGTLRTRFTADSAAPGRGVVRGKTGTLTGVTTLAGLVTSQAGDLLAYSLMADRVPAARSARMGSRAAWDRATAALALCGCR